jgi:D-sedoheptulose 7-phosphate isomerase
MENSFAEQLDQLLLAVRKFDLDALQPRLDVAIGLMCSALQAGRSVLVCGNGGSAADAQHIAGELVGKFLKARRALNACCGRSPPAGIPRTCSEPLRRRAT